MRRVRRRALIAGGGAALGALALGRFYLPRSQRPGPVRPVETLSEAAQALVRAAFDGLDPARLWDVHAHVAGLGTGGSGIEVHPSSSSHLHPWRRLQYDVYLAAAGVRDRARADEEYVERLLALQRAANPAGRLLLLAFDRRVGEDGAPDPERSPFYVPDAWVLELARRHPEVEAAVSVHPYRKDALARLEAARAAGARAVKWLPNAMGIDPASPRCDASYARMAELGLVLITHGGIEHAVSAADDQELGNPLRVRRALEHGLVVVVAHCASLGTALDLDAGGTARARALDLFVRLAQEPGTEGLLFGDLSAVPFVNRDAAVLPALLGTPELHARLVYGSDYPLPAIDLLTSTWLLARRGLLAPEDRSPLNEVFEANALLFDLVLKRRLRLSVDGVERRFPPVVFDTQRLFA